MSTNGGRTGKQWRLLCRHVYARDTHCAVCGLWVDQSLPYRNPVTGRPDGRSKSVDHIVPLALGGALLDPGNVQLVHLRHQWKQGAHLAHANKEDRNTRNSRDRARTGNRGLGQPSRDW